MRLIENTVEVNQRWRKGIKNGQREKTRDTQLCDIIRNTRDLMDGLQAGLLHKGDRL